MTKVRTKEAQVEQQLCLCGCGQAPRNKPSLWCAGHDARYKQRLIAEFDEGSDVAGQELVERGWQTQEVLDLRRAKINTGMHEKRDRLRVRVQRLDEQIAALEDQRAGLRVQLAVAERLV